MFVAFTCNKKKHGVELLFEQQYSIACLFCPHKLSSGNRMAVKIVFTIYILFFTALDFHKF